MKDENAAMTKHVSGLLPVAILVTFDATSNIVWFCTMV